MVSAWVAANGDGCGIETFWRDCEFGNQKYTLAFPTNEVLVYTLRLIPPLKASRSPTNRAGFKPYLGEIVRQSLDARLYRVTRNAISKHGVIIGAHFSE
jgi:hypothetical protein